MDPVSNLDFNSEYKVVITDKVSDKGRTALMGGDYSFNFRTETETGEEEEEGEGEEEEKIDGDLDYVDFGDVDGVEGLTQMTVSAWINIEEISYYNMIIAKEDSWYFSVGDIINGDEVIYITHGNIGSNEDEALNYHLNPSRWYHVVVTYDSGNIKLFVNGIAVLIFVVVK